MYAVHVRVYTQTYAWQLANSCQDTYILSYAHLDPLYLSYKPSYNPMARACDTSWP